MLKKLFFILSFTLPLWVFKFESNAGFRDFTMTLPRENLAHWASGSFWLWHFHNWFLKTGLESRYFWQFYLTLIFCSGVILSYIFLKKLFIVTINFKNTQKTSPNLNQISKTNQTSLIFIILAFLLWYNPFTLQRWLMGHSFFLAGQVLFLPTLFYLIQFQVEIFSQKQTQLFGFLKNPNFSKFGLLFLLSQLISQHHGYFFYLLLAFCQLIWLVFLFKTKSIKKLISQFLASSFLILINASLFLLRNQNIIENNLAQARGDSRNRIISNFSLQFFNQTPFRIFLESLVGKGAWMSPFGEFSQVWKEQSFLEKFSFYSNFYLILIAFVALILTVYNFRQSYLKLLKKHVLIPIFLSLSLLTFILNFGFFNDFFKIINAWFYWIPGSYTFREAGKFWWFFANFLILALLPILLKFSLQVKKYLITVLCLVLFFSVSPFLILNQRYNYFEYPKIFEKLEKSCTSNDKILFLPINTYLIPSYSFEVFVTRPSAVLNCNFEIPVLAELPDFKEGKDKITLSQDQKALELEQLITDLNQNQISQSSFFQKLKEYCEKNNINQIVIETFQNLEMQKVQIVLEFFAEKIEEEGSIFWYEI